MPLTNKTRYALLGILDLFPASGYDLKKFCDEVVSQFWHENYAHIYPVLKELEKEGLATKQSAQTEGRPLKNVYYITEKGREELKKWLLTPVAHAPRRYEFILKLFFSADIPVEHLITTIKQYRAEQEAVIERLRRSQKDVEEEGAGSPRRAKIWQMTINGGRLESEAMIKWCDETLATLYDMQKEGKAEA
jgi:PadR family transcriptional regulator, regulatory protein AphA